MLQFIGFQRVGYNLATEQQQLSFNKPVLEKNMKSVYIWITKSFSCIAEINTTLQINYTSVKK